MFRDPRNGCLSGTSGRPGASSVFAAEEKMTERTHIFERTLQTAYGWVDEVAEEIGADRQVAWNALGAVLRATRDRLPIGLAAHFAAELPTIIRGAYYDQFRPSELPDRSRTLEEFLEHVGGGMGPKPAVDVQDATRAVFKVTAAKIDKGQADNVRAALPEPVRQIWPDRSASAAGAS
jgi:uncharacterized protein (DUF2267 family)